jgi:predicted ester cyclase
MSPPLLESLVARFYHDLWNEADDRVASEILHPEFDFRGSLGPTRTGPDGFVTYMREVHAALGNYTCTIEDLIVSNDRAAARMRFDGVHRSAFFGVPATGRLIIWGGAAFFTLRDRKIGKLWVLGDIDSIKQQLGAARAASFE